MKLETDIFLYSLDSIKTLDRWEHRKSQSARHNSKAHDVPHNKKKLKALGRVSRYRHNWRNVRNEKTLQKVGNGAMYNNHNNVHVNVHFQCRIWSNIVNLRTLNDERPGDWLGTWDLHNFIRRIVYDGRRLGEACFIQFNGFDGITLLTLTWRICILPESTLG